jgi:hypothetical protein
MQGEGWVVMVVQNRVGGVTSRRLKSDAVISVIKIVLLC